MIQNLKSYLKNKLLRPIWNSQGYFSYFNQKIFFPKNSVIFNRAIEEGIYERDNIMIIKRFVRPNSTMFDVGANIGLMAIPILNMKQGVKVISIEPSPNTFPYLKKTHIANSHVREWQLINEAVSNEMGEIDFQLATPENGAYESILDTKRSSFVDVVKVKCNTIDNIWKQNVKPDVSFIKLDIEGADLLALRGATECIEACRPSILMEWNYKNIIPFKLTHNDLIEFASNINYSIYSPPFYNRSNTETDLRIYCHFDENLLLLPN